MTNKRKVNVFITGASSGIGRGCAGVFAMAGANLILLARRKERIDELAEILNKEYGTMSYCIDCDVRNYEEVTEKINKIPAKWKKIDVLINNAGLARGLDKIQDGLLSDWEEMIDTNVKGLLYVSKAVIPGMIKRKSGHIINIASIAGREIYPKGNVYCATKSAVRALSKSMVIDLNGTGVRVTNLDPGIVETEFSKIRFHGDEDRAENVYKGFTPLIGEDIGLIALLCAQLPVHMNIQDILVTPSAQASATIVSKNLE